VGGQQIFWSLAGTDVENHAQLRRQQIDESPVPAFRCEWLITIRHGGGMRIIPT
jgi:hypothetical protein